MKGRGQPYARVEWRVVVAAAAVLLGFIVWNGLRSYQLLEQQQRERLIGLCDVVGDELELSLNGCNSALAAVRDELPWVRQYSDTVERLNRRFMLLAATNPASRTFVAVNRDGVIYASNQAKLRGLDVRNSERYQVMKAGADPNTLYVSAPFTTPLGMYTVSLGRVVVDGQGRFDGYLLSVLDVDVLPTLVQASAQPADMDIVLAHSDGRVFFRSPADPALESLDLTRPPVEWFMRHISGGATESYSADSDTEGQPPHRMVAVRTVKPASVRCDHTLVLAVSRSREAVFGGLRREIFIELGLGLGLVLIGVASLATLQRRAAEREALEASQASVLDRMPLAIYAAGAKDQRARYVNQSFTEMFGYTSDELPTVEQWWPRAYPDPAYRARVSDEWNRRVEEAIRGRTAIEPMETEVTCKDGHRRTIVWGCIATVEEIWAFGLDLTERRLAEQALEASEEHLRLATEGGHIATWYWNLAEGTLSWSDLAKVFLALPPGETPTLDHFYEVVHPDDRDRVRSLVEGAVARRGDFSAEYRVVGPDRGIRWLSALGRVFTHLDGSVRAMVGVLIDITDDKKAAQERERVQRLLQEGERIAGMGSWEYIAAGQQTVWSPGERALFGLAPDTPSPDYITMLRQYIHPDDAQKLDVTLRAAIERRVPFESEHRIVRPDGTIRILLDRAVPYFDVKGELEGYSGNSLDVTEQRRLESALKESEGRLRALFESITDIIFVKDAAGRYLTANPATLSVVGKPREAVIGQDDRAFFPADVAEAINAIDRRILSTGKSETFEERLVFNDGTERYFITTKGTLPLADGSTGLFAIARDVTEPRLQEQRQIAALTQAKIAAEAANIAKTQFLRNMSHEIRTPLNAITGMAYLLKRATLTADEMKKVEHIEDAAGHLLEIVDSILDLSRIESGRFIIDDAPVSIDEVVRKMVSLVDAQCRDKGLALEVEPLPALPPLRGDSQHLGQALLNYLSNAVKFTEAGTIKVRVRATRETPREVTLRFEVDDTGPGIAPDALPRLFNLFEQVDNTNTRRYGGTGLGLAITRELARLMGGEAGVQSQVGRGSTFWFTACLRKETGAASAEQPADRVPDAARDRLKAEFPDLRVMVVDDEPLNRQIIAAVLADVWSSVDTAEDGLQAIDRALGQKYDLILMDVQMPKMSGLEATQRIRARCGGPPPRMIALSANAFEAQRDEAMGAGMDGYITKPVTGEALFQLLLAHLTPAEKKV